MTRAVPHSRLVRRTLAGVLVLAVAATLRMATTHVGVFASSPPRSATHSCPIPKSSHGAPAITPTLPCRVPSFTAADVIAFYHLKSINGVYTQTVGIQPGFPPYQLANIQFLPAAQVDAILRDQSGEPANYLLCLAQFQGKFSLAGISAPPGPPRDPNAFMTQSYTVFDATTGNVIEWGLRP